MKKRKIKKIVNDCLENRKLCRAYCKYDHYYWYLFPLRMNDDLFLSIKEEDFILDGYTIRRFQDVKKAEIKSDKCIEILEKEGIIDSIITPTIDITSWKSAFTDLKEMNQYVIVEQEDINATKSWFVIGSIEGVHKNSVSIRHFDADGIWEKKPHRIPYDEITSLTFDSRYVNFFSKYLE